MAGLQSAAEGYLALASHISKVALYELPQVVIQIPLPPMYVPMPIQKALLVVGESKVVNHLIHVLHLLLSIKSKAFSTDKEFSAGQYSIKRKA